MPLRLPLQSGRLVLVRGDEYARMPAAARIRLASPGDNTAGNSHGRMSPADRRARAKYHGGNSSIFRNVFPVR